MLSKDYILGFVEGEGCFCLAVQRYVDRKPRLTTRVNKIVNPYLFRVRITFRITNCLDNLKVLEEIKETLGFGRIYQQNRKNPYARPVAYFYTNSIQEAQATREYFKGANFRTTKGKDFELWCKGLELFEANKHLGKEGLLEICALRDQMNDRLAKKKWTKEDVLKAFESNQEHIAAHHDSSQESLVPERGSSSEWLKKKQGNFKQQRETKLSEKTATSTTSDT